jgi:hypothetical protein
MPHARNEGFVGRARLLEEIRRALRPDADAARTVALTQVQAVHGLGGIGKTQLAIEFVHAQKAEFDAIFWVLADTPARLASDFADLARELGLPEATQTADVNEQARAVSRWLESPASGLALGTYLDQFRERRAELLRRGDPPEGDALTVFATLDGGEGVGTNGPRPIPMRITRGRSTRRGRPAAGGDAGAPSGAYAG